jgi:Domain of unknown function (DUF4440)
VIVRSVGSRGNTSFLVQTGKHLGTSLAGMKSGASTPEELESLLEDAFVTCDRDAFAELFDSTAVLIAGARDTEARGGAEIARRTAALCERGFRYVADAQRVVRSRDTTLVVAEHAVNVMHRGRDRRWRYAISLLTPESTHEGGKRWIT